MPFKKEKDNRGGFFQFKDSWWSLKMSLQTSEPEVSLARIIYSTEWTAKEKGLVKKYLYKYKNNKPMSIKRKDKRDGRSNFFQIKDWRWSLMVLTWHSHLKILKAELFKTFNNEELALWT